MKKRLAALTAALLMLLLCGCSQGAAPTAYTEASEVSLRFYSTLGDPADAAITSEVLESFTAENSYITLYYTSVTADEAYKLSLPDSSTYRNTPPDIVYGPVYVLSDLLGEEYASIEDIRSVDSDFAADTADYAFLRDSSGNAYGVSVRGDGHILVVNTDLSEGLSDPLEIARNISDSDIFLFADNALDSELFFQYLMTVCTNSEINPMDPESHWVHGFELFSSLVKMGAFAPADRTPAELFADSKAVFAVLSESEAAMLEGENYKCAAFFGGFDEGIFITRSAMSDPLRRKAAIALAEKLLAEKERYAEGSIPSDGSGVFFSLESAMTLTPCSEGCWGEVLKGLTSGDDPNAVLEKYIQSVSADENISASDIPLQEDTSE